MSTMLEQAIVDAKALRDAAIESAERVVVERYSNQIKETVETLLEQDDLEMDMGLEEPAMDAAPAGPTAAEVDADEKWSAKGIGDVVKSLDSQLPEAFHPEVDDSKILEIDLDNLDLEDKEDLTVMTREDAPVALEEDIELDEKSLLALAEALKEECPKCEKEECDCVQAESTEEESLGDTAACSQHRCTTGYAKMVDGKCKCDDPGSADKLTEEQIEEAIYEKVAEALKFDYKPVPDGGFANGQMKPTNSIADTQEVAEIAAAIEEYNDEENSKLKKENKELKTKLTKIADSKSELMETVNKIEEKFNEVQLMNAKLHYQNQTLMDASLNERQKTKIVESLSNADSIEQAKIVFETLQSSVGSSSNEGPKSLSEVVGKRNSSSILLKASEKSEKKESNDFAWRMKALAGLKQT